jgi:hypothetical protein
MKPHSYRTCIVTPNHSLTDNGYFKPQQIKKQEENIVVNQPRNQITPNEIERFRKEQRKPTETIGIQ